MSVGLGTIFGLSADVLLVVFSLALLVLVLWQDWRRRSTQYFALCMSVLALHGSVHVVWQVAQHTNIDPQHLLYLSTSLYILGIFMLFNFVCVFAGLARRVTVILVGATAAVSGLFLVEIWRGGTYTHVQPLGAHSYQYEYTPLGLFGIAALFAFFLALMTLLYRQHDAKAQRLVVPLAALIVGAVGNGLGGEPMRDFPLNSLMITLAVLLFGHAALKVHVYQPLEDLNAELVGKIEELDQAMYRKAQFLANMSHELRTPLNSIIGYAELVVNRTYGDLTPVQDDRLQKVARNGYLLLGLINDVLDLSKIEAGRLNLRFARVPTNDLLDSVLAAHEPVAQSKGLKLMRGYGKLPSLWVDGDRVRQILENLLSNAVKYTERGVVIARGYYDLAHQQVVLSITDTGPGIPPEKQDHLFDIYNLPDGETRAAKHEGIGLGLALTYQLTSMHGGKLWFETVPGLGTTFHVALPAFDDSLEIRRPVVPRSRNDGPVILAIDDDLEALEVLQGQIEARGYQVYGARTANDGLMLARELMPVVITLDIAMPDLDGWHILDALRSDPATRAIPVVIVSARDDENVEQRAKADGFLKKPAQPEMLFDLIRECTGQPHPSERARRLTPTIRRRQEEEPA